MTINIRNLHHTFYNTDSSTYHPSLILTLFSIPRTMPPARSSPSSRSTENVLGMGTNEIRLLLIAHLCIDKESGKVRSLHL